ncbi:MAG: class I SAM-dependent methyltransferase [Promethearchaeota archaeon]
MIKEDEFPLEDGVVDLFFSTQVLHEVADHDRFLAELDHVLKPGGVVFSVDFQKEAGWEGPRAKHRLSLEEARDLFSRPPFRVVESGPVFGKFYYMKAEKTH